MRYMMILPALALTVLACSQNPTPNTAAAPMPDTAAIARQRADSIAAAAAASAAAEQARQDSLRLAERRRADSIAAAEQTRQALEASIATLIHFDFDKSNIRVEDQTTLDDKVAILRANPALQIEITGNCDERGSDEYNLALGNRRAMAAKSYFVTHGIDAGRIQLASNGEERPVDPGHNETAWAMNRNDQFRSTTPAVSLIKP